MSPRVVLYSAIFGGYDAPKPLPPGLTCDAVLFTDDPDLEAPGWEIRTPDVSGINTYMLRHKIFKCQPEMWLPHHDIALWVDGSMTLVVDDYPERCVAALGEDDLSLMRHPARDCVYTEASFSTHLPRYRDIGIEDQVSFYRSVVGHPAGWGLFATGAMARRIHTAASVELSRNWWWENLRRTHQDQVSLPVLVRLMRDQLRWNTNLPWGEWWGISEHEPWAGDFRR